MAPRQGFSLVSTAPFDGAAATRLARAAGLDCICFFLDGGMGTWREERRPTRSVTRIGVLELRERIDEVQVLDVRTEHEWRNGSIAGAIHRPYYAIDCVPEEIDRALPVAVVCASGARSAIAASLLRRLAVTDVLHVADGGVPTWRSHGWPLVSPAEG